MLNKNQFIHRARMMDEACRQWYAFIEDDKDRADGEGFTEFYRQICDEKYEEYLENPGMYDFEAPDRIASPTKSGRVQTFELDRWSEPDENHRVRHIGMADAKETFDKLKTHLESNGLLPDEYFLYSKEYSGELPEFDEALCIPSFGASEGIYLDISLACRDENGNRYFQHFATGKTLGETADDYMRMFRIAAECSLMLNGRGFTYERNNVDIVLTEEEAEAVANSVELDLCGYLEPDAEAILSSALDKIARIPYTAIQTVTCHGKDDYSLTSMEIPTDMFRSIQKENATQIGPLEKLLDRMNTQSGGEMKILSQMQNNLFAFYTIPERLSYLQEYTEQGCSVRGSKEQIMAEIYTEWEPAEEAEDELER